MMVDAKTGLEDLKEIRNIMERSSTFVSLSGFSGVIIGIIGIITSVVMGYLWGNYLVTTDVLEKIQSNDKIRALTVTVLSVSLVLSVSSAFIFSLLKSKKNSLRIFSKISVTFAAHLFIPLITGGIFIIALFLKGYYELIIPSMLIFYGLSLYSASKFTIKEVGFLGISVVIIGLFAILFVPYSLILWTAGFGICTIAYGLNIYSKYEK
jgi:hypothetical protein